MKQARMAVFALFFCLTLGAYAQTGSSAKGGDPGAAPSIEGVSGDAVLYASILEDLLRRDFGKAETDAKLLREGFPDSPYVERADAMIAAYGRKRDSSGLVPFFTGGLLSGWGSSAVLPTAFGLVIGDTATLGALYLGGAASGLVASWLMSRDRDFTLAQDLWIETVEVVSLANWNFLFDAWYPSPSYGTADYAGPIPTTVSTRDRILAAGMVTAMIGSRALTYSVVRDMKPSLGRVALAAQTAAWATFYSGVIQGELLRVEDQRLMATVNVAAMDAGLVGGALVWDSLGWGAFRSGLVSVGGVSGILVGVSLDMIFEGLLGSMDSRVPTLINLGGALAGQALAVFFTRGMERETLTGFHLEAKPVASRYGTGIELAAGLYY
jgi:hypothetical protein